MGLQPRGLTKKLQFDTMRKEMPAKEEMRMCTAAPYRTRDFYFGRTLDYEFSYGERAILCITTPSMKRAWAWRD